MVWAAYGLDFGPVHLPWGGSVPFVAPDYFHGAIRQWELTQQPHDFYLLGMHSNTGWWYYYAVVLAVKLPAGILLLALGGLAARPLGLRLSDRELYLWLPALVLLLYLSLFNTKHNGIRYLLPVYPLVLVLLGQFGSAAARLPWLRIAVCGAVAWVAVSSLRAWPDYISYFNEVSGGPQEGHRWLGDSNLDWGQDLIELRDYMEEHGVDEVRLSYFGTADPTHYGIAHTRLAAAEWNRRQALDPEALGPVPPSAISVYHWQGIDRRSRLLFERFRAYEPNDVVGHSILIFDPGNLIRSVE